MTSTTWSAMAMTAGRWLTTRAEAPEARTALIAIASVDWSRPAVGSPSTSRRAPPSSMRSRALASATRRRSPRTGPPLVGHHVVEREAASTGTVEGVAQLGIGGIRVPHPHIVGDGAVDHARVLRHIGDVVAPVGHVDLGKVLIADADLAGGGRLEAHQH